jgi:hypothetical protein
LILISLLTKANYARDEDFVGYFHIAVKYYQGFLAIEREEEGFAALWSLAGLMRAVMDFI